MGLLGLLRQHEGAGNPSTLFGHSQRSGGPFAGVDVSKMTIGQLRDFSRPDGAYGQWVKGQVGRVATPMGFGQIVGTTMRNTADALGLPDETVFDGATQSRMVNHLASQRLGSATTPQGKRAAIRAEWEGLKNVSDAELDRAIADFEQSGGIDPNQAIADDTMRALGRGPVYSTAIGGQGADTMNTPRQGLLGQIARPDEKVGGLLGMMFGNMSPDRADQLRANLGGLQGINNQGMVDAARGRMRARSGARESDLNYARQQQQTEQERQREAQRTAQAEAWIAQNAPDEIVAAMRSGVLTPQQAYTIANKPPEGAPAAVKALEQRALLGGLEPGTPEYQQFMIDGGAKSGLALSVGSDGSVSFSAGGASVKSLTDGQAKDTVYVTRAEGALAILDQYDSNLAVLGNRMLDADPTGLVRGKLQDTDYQLARQAGDEFLQAILRKDTGAAITEPEQELYGTTYLPRPGDGPEVIAQKKQSRKRAIEAIKAGMPPSAIVAKELALLRSGDAKPDAPDGATDADGWQVIDGVRIRVKP